MVNEIPLSPEELDYENRATRIYEEMQKNPNLSLGILVEQLAENEFNKVLILSKKANFGMVTMLFKNLKERLKIITHNL
ncbi:MAG: hypothetical protein ACFFDB_19745 [Promethearchaeota archaeon]